MLNKLILPLLVIISLLVSSCKDEIDVSLHSVAPRLVIEGVIRLGEPAKVKITKTKDFIGSNQYPTITDAAVTIRQGADAAENLIPNEGGIYVSTDIVGIQRNTYHLSVTYQGQEYTATSYLPPAVAIDSLTLWTFPIFDYPYPMVHFTDPQGEENQYYRFVISINGEYPQLREQLFSSEFMDGSVVHNSLFVQYNDDRSADPVNQGDVIGIEMRCLDKGTYKFFETWSRMEESLANPTSNITGGALGYFGAYSFSSMGIVATW